MCPTDELVVPLLVLDIDGTVRQGKDDALGRFVNSADDVQVFPEATEMMTRWKRAGGRVLGISNQGGVALGIITLVQVASAMMETQRQTRNGFDRIVWCIHHPDAASPVMARCWCRKPSPGMIVEGALSLGRQYDEIYPPYIGLMVGDRPEDEACARLANLDFESAADWRAQAGQGVRT